jgi:hypothetical protein
MITNPKELAKNVFGDYKSPPVCFRITNPKELVTNPHPYAFGLQIRKSWFSGWA